MNNKKNVTFVVPAYIESEIYLKFLEETIEGLLKQTDERWNAVIIDDHSPVQGMRLLKDKYPDQRIHWIHLNERRTTGACRNIGIEWAKQNNTDYILFNDADDISDCNRVKLVKEIFEKNPTIDVIYSSVRVIDENCNEWKGELLPAAIKEIIDVLESKPPVGKNCWYDIGLITGYVNITSSTSVRLELAAEELFPDEMISEDSHTWYRYAARGEFYYSDYIHVSYRIPSFVRRQSSESYTKDFNLDKIRVDKDGFSKAMKIVENKGSIKPEQEKILYFKFLMRLIESMKKNNRLDLCYDLAMECNELFQLDFAL